MRSGLPTITACLILAVDRMATERRAETYVTYTMMQRATLLAKYADVFGGCWLGNRFRGRDGRIRLELGVPPQDSHEARREAIVELGAEAPS